MTSFTLSPQQPAPGQAASQSSSLSNGIRSRLGTMASLQGADSAINDIASSIASCFSGYPIHVSVTQVMGTGYGPIIPPGVPSPVTGSANQDAGGMLAPQFCP